MMDSFIEYLKNRLQHSLPGTDAQFRMAPKPVDEGPPREMNAPDHARQSSVLILIYPNDECELELLLTLRTSGIDHGGQISFPGGRSEEGESAVETALREANEEVGINMDEVEVVGRLTNLYVNHSNNQVTPIVGYLPEAPELSLDPGEVEEAFSVELDSLIHKKNLTVEDWELGNYSFKVPFWDVHRVPLWGATAMMLNEFLEIYREYKGESSKSK